MLIKTKLETERLLLRSSTPDDFEAYHSWCSSPENVRYMSFGPNNEEETKAWLAQVKPGRDFAVVLKESNAVIGSCGIYWEESGYMADVGWILHKDYHKHGYGTELCGELIRYGFEDLKLGRLQAPCAAVNYGSYRIMERNGMIREGLQRKAFWARMDKEWIDKAWYAIFADDYFVERSSLIGKTVNVTERQHELREALRSINSTIGKCEKAQLKLTEGTPQHTLTKRRIEAFCIAVSLIEKELREENNDVAMP